MAKFNVEQGKRYQATISLTWWEQLRATNDYIKDKFEEVGFSNVRVWGEGGTRYAQGTWNKPNDGAELPSQVVPESVKVIPTDPSPDVQMAQAAKENP
jgi:hypothetical protein